MSFSFKTILIPVDFSVNTEVAIKKALDLAEQQATVHLLHVATFQSESSFLFRHPETVAKVANNKQIIQRLAELKATIEAHTRNPAAMVWISKRSSVQQAIEEKARQLSVDLIVIGKRSHHTWLPLFSAVVPSQVARNTGIAVLTAKPGAIHNKIRTMIVPISTDVSRQKLEIVAAICKKFSINIHLIAFLNSEHEPMDFYASALLQSYQWLKANTHCQVEYAVLHGTNKARALLQYTEKISADILLVHPESETRTGWLNIQLPDMLPAESKVEVMVVSE